ncbi:solute carrier organic anion transporter family member 2B1-like [Copidosoma floridanum]|uniref:solute carrier organic anion transporter family member 2B1-like n=1 Tax=Copidosoma floridanum TaxID=29053 RepID=UPI0006C9676A|nr:solute carrier organic anion transporter family member 2B1-like [Copidosoma floridanum]XP_014214470.1 solute carrier organic anion transporter family member 2B1-like [Copidosoma floridanum]
MSQSPANETARTEEEEGVGLAGPANSLTMESIDCGCAQYRLQGLAKFATRRVLLALLCSIGFLQAAIQAYFYVASATISRRFQIDPHVMGWVLYVSDVTPVLIGLAVAYWGDRIHRAAWLGGLTLLQCAGLLGCVIPRISRWDERLVDTDDTTHASIYAEDSPELCSPMLPLRAINKEDVPRYSTLFLVIVMQVVSGMAHVAYCALGLSYLDDNTKKVHVSAYLGVAIAAKVLGNALGYLLGWSLQRIDADDLSSVKSYRDQFGAWWLGWPIFAVLLAIPGVLMAIFPRKLPSEMVEQAAATILHESGTLRNSRRLASIKVGSTAFVPSLARLVTNKILVCNVLAAVFVLTALVNFSANENVLLESRFLAPRPTGRLLGFGDPLLSRLIATMTRPLLIGLAIVVAGLLIRRAKPGSRTLVIYSLAVLLLSALVVLGLAFNDCEKARIRGFPNRGSVSPREYCNKDCQCTRDADFRPVCDSRGEWTFYSPCHAGCTSMDNQYGTQVYYNCSCIGVEKGDARDGPCDSDSCQAGWLIHEIMTMLVYAAVASTVVGDLLVVLRSVNVQDKALAIGYGLTILGLLAYVPGKIGYDKLVESTCWHWGLSVCHLHRPSLASYLCFLTAGLIFLGALLKVATWLFSKDLEIYDPIEEERQPEQTEMVNVARAQAEPLLQTHDPSPWEGTPRDDQEEAGPEVGSLDPEIAVENPLGKANGPVASVSDEWESSGRPEYGQQSKGAAEEPSTDEDSSDDGRSKRSKVSYRPLELDSDGGSESEKPLPTSSLDELSRPPQRIQPSGERRFPNPENYGDPRLARSSKHNSPQTGTSGSQGERPVSKGDFNEIGIPLVNSYEPKVEDSTKGSLRSPMVMVATQHLDGTPSGELLDENRFAYRSPMTSYYEEMEENRNFRLRKLMQPVEYPSPSRDQASSSGFGSFQDLRDRLRLHDDASDSRGSLSSKTSDSEPPKNKGSPLCTNL